MSKLNVEKLIQDIQEIQGNPDEIEDEFEEGYVTACDDIIFYLRWGEWP